MSDAISNYYRCPEQYVRIAPAAVSSQKTGYFKFGKDVLYGKGPGAAKSATDNLPDLLPQVLTENGTVQPPFDVSEVIDNLRYETYNGCVGQTHPAQSITGKAYYLFRPALSVKVRRHLQKIRLGGWKRLRFPKWPVDSTVDSTLENLLLLSLRSSGRSEIPFIWFWPNGASSCAIMTHDVETTAGRDFCSSLMDINDRFGIKASFQVVPERRYDVPESYLGSIRSRGFEINVQDLNHDGFLFRDREEFLARVPKINAYGRQFGAVGFRSAVLYRQQQWYDSLEFLYDMSVPNVAHLDPQRGGCCTVMPYFIGNILELPVTTTQDYSLFHILNDHSLDLWKQQCELIMSRHGLISFIVHPDYIIGEAERATYENLLAYLNELRMSRNVWITLAGEAAQWWKERFEMKLVHVNGTWQIVGKGRERARIAYAREGDGKLVYSFKPHAGAAEIAALGATMRADVNYSSARQGVC